MPKIVTVLLTLRGLKQNQGVCPRVQEEGGCQGHFRNWRTPMQSLLLFSFLPDCFRELLHQAKAEAFFCFSLSSLLASGLQENLFLNLKLFQGKFCKWELLVSVPSTSASFLPQCNNNSELQRQHHLGPTG